MSTTSKRLSRRGFLIRSAMFALGAFGGTSLIARPFAHALARQPAAAPSPRIAFILDDVGCNLERLRPFLELNIPITYAILPHMQYSRTTAEKIHASGHEIMLHQPMEPYNRALNPGPGALYLSQTAAELEKNIRSNLDNFPHAAGVNNHMGSRFTESRPKMLQALSFFLQREFYFIDSCTSVHSVGFETARSMDMTAAFSHEFVDTVRTEAAVYAQLVKLKLHALKTGAAIGIGHPWPETVQGLGRFAAELKGSPFTMVYASQLVTI